MHRRSRHHSKERLGLRQTVEIKTDEFDPHVKFSGIEFALPGSSALIGRFFLRSFIPKNPDGKRVHQIYVLYYYADDWNFFYGARNCDAQSLEFSSLNREVISCRTRPCTHAETFVIQVPEESLRNTDSRGYLVKVYAKSGYELLIPMTAEQIQKQVAAIDGYNKPQ
jgi:hypothetical protein